MSRLRHGHKHRMAGGMTSKPQWNAGASQNAAKEAEELKKGGKVHAHGEGEHAKKRHDRAKRRAAGGTIARKHGGHVAARAEHTAYGKKHKEFHVDGMSLDGTGAKMPKRKHGGYVHDGVEHPDGDVKHEKGRAHVGAVHHHKHGGHVHDEHEHHHKRARGGRLRGEGVGADRTPLSQAAKIKEIVPDETPAHGIRSD